MGAAGVGLVEGWILAGKFPDDAVAQVSSTVLSSREATASGILHLAQIALTYQAHINFLQKRITVLEAAAQVTPDPSTVF